MRYKPLPLPFRYIFLAGSTLILILLLQSYMTFTMRYREGFIVSAETIARLQEDGVPDSVLTALEQIRDREIWGEGEFIEALQMALPPAQCENYKPALLQFSRRITPGFNWAREVWILCVNYLLWVVLAPLVYNLLHLFPLDKKLRVRQWLVFGGIAIAVASFHEIFSTVIYFSPPWLAGQLTVDDYLLGHIISGIPGGIVSRLIEYVVIFGIFLAIDYYRKFQRKQLQLVTLEKELSDARLRALQMQLQPHFLFNTLHTISSLMEKNVEGAQKVVSQLGYLLRTILEQNREHSVPLARELVYVRSYLDIEQVRFNDRLQIKYDIGEDTRRAMVPSLILQPLVENAVKHGFSKRTDCGVISVTSRKQADRLVLIVEDDGIGSADCRHLVENGGVGLRNVKGRLEQIYKSEFRFELRSPLEQGFIARIEIPCLYPETAAPQP